MNMMKFAGLLLLLCSTFLSAEKAIDTTPCELEANPSLFDKRLVTVRSTVRIGFEDSSFDVKCNPENSPGVWVTFADDVEMPIVFCCGDHSRDPGTTLTLDGIQLTLKKDSEFKKFYRLLTATRELVPSGVPCFWDCYQYRVAATLTGHFFATKTEINEDGLKYITGYGHFGFNSLFVIEKVENVESRPTGIPIGEDFKCEKETWDLPAEKSAVLAEQIAVKSEQTAARYPDEMGDELVKEKMKNVGDDFELGDSRWDAEGDLDKEKKASYFWLSKDKLKSYKVSFQRFDWLSEIESEIKDRIWTPIKIERGSCTPKE
jgi:hypothetical protein